MEKQQSIGEFISARRIKRIARMKEKGLTNTEIARKVGVSLVTVAKDLKEARKE